MNNWITIITFTYPHEAHLAKNMLEAQGVEVIIKDELTAQVNNFYSNAIGGVKLQVEDGNADIALQYLKEAGYISEENADDDYEAEVFPKEYGSVCPYCKSGEVTKKRMPGYVFVFSFLLLGLPLPFIKRRYYCFDCNREWKVDRSK